MTELIRPPPLKPGCFPKERPHAADVALLGADCARADQIIVVCVVGPMLPQKRHGLRGQGHDLATRLAVGEAQARSLEVDHPPAQARDLADPSARQHEQPQAQRDPWGDGPGRARGALLGLVDRRSEGSAFLGSEESLSPLLAKPSDPATRVAASRDLALALRPAHEGGQHGQGAVRDNVPHPLGDAVFQTLDVAILDGIDAGAPQLRGDVVAEDQAVQLLGARLPRTALAGLDDEAGECIDDQQAA